MRSPLYAIARPLNLEKQYIETLVKFTQKELSFDDLYNEFYFHYMDECPDLETSVENFLGDICEKMDYTADEGNPDEEDRKYGWINIDEFRLWLINYLNENHEKVKF